MEELTLLSRAIWAALSCCSPCLSVFIPTFHTGRGCWRSTGFMLQQFRRLAAKGSVQVQLCARSWNAVRAKESTPSSPGGAFTSTEPKQATAGQKEILNYAAAV